MWESIFTIIIALLLTSCDWASPGQGDKIGQVSRITKEGVICKTTTVLVTGKFGGGELKVTVPEYSTDLITKVAKYNDSQEQVKVTYHKDMVKFSCSNSTDNAFLDSIEPHPEGAAK